MRSFGDVFAAAFGESGWHATPGKSGCLSYGSGKFSVIMLNNSAKTQPADHMSIAKLYMSLRRITSGALYHLVTTCLVRLLLSSRRLRDFRGWEPKSMC